MSSLVTNLTDYMRKSSSRVAAQSMAPDFHGFELTNKLFQLSC